MLSLFIGFWFYFRFKLIWCFISFHLISFDFLINGESVCAVPTKRVPQYTIFRHVIWVLFHYTHAHTVSHINHIGAKCNVLNEDIAIELTVAVVISIATATHFLHTHNSPIIGKMMMMILGKPNLMIQKNSGSPILWYCIVAMVISAWHDCVCYLNCTIHKTWVMSNANIIPCVFHLILLIIYVYTFFPFKNGCCFYEYHILVFHLLFFLFRVFSSYITNVEEFTLTKLRASFFSANVKQKNRRRNGQTTKTKSENRRKSRQSKCITYFVTIVFRYHKSAAVIRRKWFRNQNVVCEVLLFRWFCLFYFVLFFCFIFFFWWESVCAYEKMYT